MIAFEGIFKDIHKKRFVSISGWNLTFVVVNDRKKLDTETTFQLTQVTEMQCSMKTYCHYLIQKISREEATIHAEKANIRINDCKRRLCHFARIPNRLVCLQSAKQNLLLTLSHCF